MFCNKDGFFGLIGHIGHIGHIVTMVEEEGGASYLPTTFAMSATLPRYVIAGARFTIFFRFWINIVSKSKCNNVSLDNLPKVPTKNLLKITVNKC